MNQKIPRICIPCDKTFHTIPQVLPSDLDFKGSPSFEKNYFIYNLGEVGISYSNSLWQDISHHTTIFT